MGSSRIRQGGLLGQGAGQNDPLLLPTGEGGKGPPGEAGHAHQLQRLGHQPEIVGGVPVQGPLVGGTAHHDHILDGKLKVIIIVLSYHGNAPGGLPIAVLVQIPSIQQHRAAGGLQHPVDAFEQSTLSAAVGADDPYQLPLAHLDVHAL